MNELAIFKETLNSSQFMEEPQCTRDGFWYYNCCNKRVTLPEEFQNRFISEHGDCPDCFDVKGFTQYRNCSYKAVVEGGKLLTADATGNRHYGKIATYKNGKWQDYDPPVTEEMIEEYLQSFDGPRKPIEHLSTLTWSLRKERELIAHINNIFSQQWSNIGYSLIEREHVEFLEQKGKLKEFLTAVQVPMMNHVFRLCTDMAEVARRMESAGASLMGGY